ncbi:hypothetical protein SMICM304S_05059 [Streptomyces microflavus]
MGRTEYYNDPKAPKANTLIPANNLLVATTTAPYSSSAAGTPASGPCRRPGHRRDGGPVRRA